MKTFVYILRGSNGRHYVGLTNDLDRRLAQHKSGQTHTTRRMGETLELIVHRSYESREVAAIAERRLKSWKNPTKVIEFLRSR